MMYWNTKEYVSDHVVRPVMKRADSFGDLVDAGLDLVDGKIEKYLPDKETANTNGVENENTEELMKKNHAFRFETLNSI
jgi:hypothetical protein